MKNLARVALRQTAVLALSGVLLLVGFVVNAIQRRLLHPTGEEDDHKAIFTEYAASDAWVATHLAEFVLVLVALAGLLLLCGALRRGLLPRADGRWRNHRDRRDLGRSPAVDGVTLKQAVDAQVAASGTEGQPAMPMRKPFAGSSGASRATSRSCSAWPSCSWVLRLS